MTDDAEHQTGDYRGEEWQRFIYFHTMSWVLGLGTATFAYQMLYEQSVVAAVGVIITIAVTAYCWHQERQGTWWERVGYAE